MPWRRSNGRACQHDLATHRFDKEAMVAWPTRSPVSIQRPARLPMSRIPEMVDSSKHSVMSFFCLFRITLQCRGSEVAAPRRSLALTPRSSRGSHMPAVRKTSIGPNPRAHLALHGRGCNADDKGREFCFKKKRYPISRAKPSSRQFDGLVLRTNTYDILMTSAQNRAPA